MKAKIQLGVVVSFLVAAIPGVAFADSTSSQPTPVTVSAPQHMDSGAPRYYRVQSGDTLWDISRTYHVSLSNLYHWNGLNRNSLLHIGERLVVGYGSSRTLSSRGESTTPDLASATLGLEIAQYAQKFIGTPYVWGGTSPSGFDCSGLVQFTLRHFGIDATRSSYDQYRQGTVISRGNLLPGDLVFFDCYGAGASHVGIYIGDGRFVDAAGSAVRIDSLNSSYWASTYIGARRLR